MRAGTLLSTVLDWALSTLPLVLDASTAKEFGGIEFGSSSWGRLFGAGGFSAAPVTEVSSDWEASRFDSAGAPVYSHSADFLRQVAQGTSPVHRILCSLHRTQALLTRRGSGLARGSSPPPRPARLLRKKQSNLRRRQLSQGGTPGCLLIHRTWRLRQQRETGYGVMKRRPYLALPARDAGLLGRLSGSREGQGHALHGGGSGMWDAGCSALLSDQ